MGAFGESEYNSAWVLCTSLTSDPIQLAREITQGSPLPWVIPDLGPCLAPARWLSSLPW